MMFRILILLSFILQTIEANSQISYFLSNKFWRLKQATINGKEYSFNDQNSNAPTLQFTDGNIRGNGGCNAYHTKFTINSNTLDVSRVMSTRMSCNDLYLNENDYFNALAQMHQLFYTEGSSEFKLVNQSNDQLVFFAQFARSGGSYTPPPRKVFREESEDDRPRKRSKYEKPEKKLSKKEAARQKLLEKKMNSKRGKLTKKERRELMALQSKTKSTKVEKRGKKGRKEKEEKRGGKKGKSDKKEKKGKKSKSSKKEIEKKSKKKEDKKKGKKKKDKKEKR